MSKKPAKVVDMKPKTAEVETPNEGIDVQGAVVKSFFEVIVILKPGSDPVKTELLNDFQKQLNENKAAAKRVRIMYYVPVSTETKQQRHDYALSKANCKYYTVVDQNVKKQSFPSTFIADQLKTIQNLEKALETIKMSGIFRKAPNTYQPDKIRMTKEGLTERED